MVTNHSSATCPVSVWRCRLAGREGGRAALREIRQATHTYTVIRMTPHTYSAWRLIDTVIVTVIVIVIVIVIVHLEQCLQPYWRSASVLGRAARSGGSPPLYFEDEEK